MVAAVCSALIAVADAVAAPRALEARHSGTALAARALAAEAFVEREFAARELVAMAPVVLA